MDEEPKVDGPYTDRHGHSDLISVPDGGTGNLNECLVCRHDREEGT